MIHTATYRKQVLEAQLREQTFQEAIDGVRTGRFNSLSDAARTLGIEKQYPTLWRRYNAKNLPLTVEQEGTLISWIDASMIGGRPLMKQAFVDKVEELCGRKPLRRWIWWFLRRHPDCRLTGMDAVDSSSEDECQGEAPSEILPHDPLRPRDTAKEVDQEENDLASNASSSSSTAFSSSPRSSLPLLPVESSSESEIDEDCTLPAQIQLYKAKALKYRKQRDEARIRCADISARANLAAQHIQSILSIADLSANPASHDNDPTVSGNPPETNDAAFGNFSVIHPITSITGTSAQPIPSRTLGKNQDWRDIGAQCAGHSGRRGGKRSATVAGLSSMTPAGEDHANGPTRQRRRLPSRSSQFTLLPSLAQRQTTHRFS